MMIYNVDDDGDTKDTIPCTSSVNINTYYYYDIIKY